MIVRVGLVAAHLVMAVSAALATPSQPGTDTVLTRIAFGSCAFQWAPQPVFRAVADAGPDLYLSLGDTIYGDYDGKKVYPVSRESLRREWQVLADSPDWRYMVDRVPVMATWDNHDYGHHSAGAEFPLKRDSAEVFLDFFAEPEDSIRRQRAGIYTGRVFGPVGRRVQVILLDTRTFKSLPLLAQRPGGAKGSLGKYAPDTRPDSTLLGAGQWRWLQAQLQLPAEIRLVASSGQVIPDQKGMDEWGNYPLERERLLELLRAAGGTAVLLSGNVHFSEVSTLESEGNSLVEFTASGLTHTNPDYARAPNRYRVAGPVTEENFGLVEIHWDPEPSLKFSVLDAQGRVHLSHRVPPELPELP